MLREVSRRCSGTRAVIMLVLAWTAPARAQPLVAAHRGGAALWPENSLLAFRNALDVIISDRPDLAKR